MGSDLPTVDDLEVAALAAEAAMEAVNIKDAHAMRQQDASSSEVNTHLSHRHQICTCLDANSAVTAIATKPD